MAQRSVVVPLVVALGGLVLYFSLTRLTDADVALPALAALATACAATGLGALLLRALGVVAVLAEERWLFSFVAGCGVLGHAMLALAHLGAFNRAAAAALVAAGSLALFAQRRTLRADVARVPAPPWPVVAAIAPAALLVVVRCSAPPTFYDALVYHVGLPMQFAARGAAFVSPHDVFTAMPLLGELAASPALLLAGVPEAMGLVFALQYVAAIFLVAHVAARCCGARSAGYAAVAFATMPIAMFLPAASKPDLLAALMTLGALRVVGAARADGAAPRLAHLKLLALFIGFGAATKTLFLPIAAVLASPMLLPSLRGALTARGVLICAGIALGAALPPYLRNALTLGDPFWPFGAKFFGGDPLVLRTLSLLDADAVRVRNVDDVLALWRLPFDVSFTTDPNMNDLMGGLPLLGVLLLVSARLTRAIPPLPPALALFFALLALSLPAWLFSHRLVRYDPLLWTVGPLAAGHALAVVGRPRLTAVVVGLLVAANLAWSAAADEVLLRRPLLYATRQLERDAFLAQAIEPAPMYAHMNGMLQQDACVLLAHADLRIAYLNVPAIVSERYAQPVPVSLLMQPPDLREQMRALGATHVLWSALAPRIWQRQGWLDDDGAARLSAAIAAFGDPILEDGPLRLFAVPDAQGGGCR